MCHVISTDLEQELLLQLGRRGGRLLRRRLVRLLVVALALAAAAAALYLLRVLPELVVAQILEPLELGVAQHLGAHLVPAPLGDRERGLAAVVQPVQVRARGEQQLDREAVVRDLLGPRRLAATGGLRAALLAAVGSILLLASVLLVVVAV